MDLEKLVEAIREYRCLWDVSKNSVQGQEEEGKCLKGGCKQGEISALDEL